MFSKLHKLVTALHIFLHSANTLLQESQYNEDDKIAFAFIISRHGARTPEIFRPVAPNVYNEDMFSVDGEGTLTPSGMR